MLNRLSWSLFDTFTFYEMSHAYILHLFMYISTCTWRKGDKYNYLGYIMSSIILCMLQHKMNAWMKNEKYKYLTGVSQNTIICIKYLALKIFQFLCYSTKWHYCSIMIMPWGRITMSVHFNFDPMWLYTIYATIHE